MGERYNKRLRVRAEFVPVLREMVDRAMRGDTYTSIAEWLDESGVSTVHGKPWSQTSVRTVLSSPALKGRYLNGEGEVTHESTDCLIERGTLVRGRRRVSTDAHDGEG